MGFRHLTTTDRIRIETLFKLGYSTRTISAELKIHHSTIAREIKRGTVSGRYEHATAQTLAAQRRVPSARTSVWTQELNDTITARLLETWSPEQIAGWHRRVQRPMVGAKTIYNWINQGRITFLDRGKITQLTVRFLPQRGLRKGSYVPDVIQAIGTSIRYRPKEVQRRKVFGHWEADTVVSSRGKSSGCIATFCERTTRMLIAFKLPNRTADAMNSAIETIVAMLPHGAVKSMTVDRGKEFASYRSVASKCKLKLYFADPFSAWQRGTIENANGLLRRFYPKQTDLALIDPRELQKYVALINRRPRACLDMVPSAEAFLLQLSQLI